MKKKKKIEVKKSEKNLDSKIKDLRDLKGKIIFSDNYDYKAMRLNRLIE